MPLTPSFDLGQRFRSANDQQARDDDRLHLRLSGCSSGRIRGYARRLTIELPAPAILPPEIGGVRVPDTALAKSVVSLVREVYPDPVFNHVTRSFVFGSKLGQVRNQKYDEEVLFVAAMSDGSRDTRWVRSFA
jgi:hypothetical protein